MPSLRITGYRSKNPADVSCRTRGHRHELPLIISGLTFRSRRWAEDFCGGDAGVFDRGLARYAAAVLAMASVFITSNPLTGATSSKAVYRILGTLIGGAGTIVLIPNLVNAPELLSLYVAFWYGILLYFALIDGTPRSYVFMLAGYTVALLGFPVVSTPELTFDIVVSRVQEITLGIICASVVSMLVLPQSVASAIAAQTDSWLAAARRLGADALTGSGSEHERDKERMRLAAAASQIDELSGHLGYETAASANAVRCLQRLRQHMMSLLPLLASIEDQKATLNAHGAMPAGTAEICARAARWLGEGGAGGQEADLMHAALDEVQPALNVDGGWTEILAASLVTQLRHLVEIIQDCLILREAIADGRDPDPFRSLSHATFGCRRLASGPRACALGGWSYSAFRAGLLRVLDRDRMGRWRVGCAVRRCHWRLSRRRG
jgi:uncharacterized membrane protein YccC